MASCREAVQCRDTTPLVSVVTPCYNHAPYLVDYFGGLLAQTYRNIELVFHDDGSTDDSWAIAKSYEDELRRTFARVSLTRSTNCGAHATLERVVAAATGEYLCILESDDYYRPTKIEKSVEFLEESPAFGAVHTECTYRFADRTEERYWRSEQRAIPAGDVFRTLATQYNFIMTCTFCARRDVFLRHARLSTYRQRRYLMADYPIFLDIASKENIGYIDEPLSIYRCLDGSASRPHDPVSRYRFQVSTYQIMIDAIRDHNRYTEEIPRLMDNLNTYRYSQGEELRLYSEYLQGYHWIKKTRPELVTAGFRLRRLSVLWLAILRVVREQLGRLR